MKRRQITYVWGEVPQLEKNGAQSALMMVLVQVERAWNELDDFSSDPGKLQRRKAASESPSKIACASPGAPYVYVHHPLGERNMPVLPTTSGFRAHHFSARSSKAGSLPVVFRERWDNLPLGVSDPFDITAFLDRRFDSCGGLTEPRHGRWRWRS